MAVGEQVPGASGASDTTRGTNPAATRVGGPPRGRIGPWERGGVSRSTAFPLHCYLQPLQSSFPTQTILRFCAPKRPLVLPISPPGMTLSPANEPKKLREKPGEQLGETAAPQRPAQRNPPRAGTPSPRAPPGLLTGREIARLFVSVAAVACGRADARLSAPTLFGLLLTSPWAAINPEFLYLASGFPRAALSPARNYSCWDLPLSRRIL